MAKRSVLFFRKEGFYKVTHSLLYLFILCAEGLSILLIWKLERRFSDAK